MPTIKIQANPGRRTYTPDNTLAMFSEFLTGETKNGGDEYVMYCPLHEDPSISTSPSASLHVSTGQFFCFSQDHGGSVADLVDEMKRELGFNSRSAIQKGKHKSKEWHERTTGALNNQPLPTADRLAKWTKDLFADKDALTAFQDKRGLNERTLRENSIGWDAVQGRYTIPVYTAEGVLVNVRKYKLNAEPSDKMRSITGHGGSVLYRPDVIRDNDEIVLCEGELDALLLNQMGIPAASGTGGAKRWKPEWNRLFAGKTVFVAYDADETGRDGARKVAGSLRSTARAVLIIELPATAGVHGYDVTDYLHADGYEVADFRALMDALRPAAEPERLAVTGRKISLAQSLLDTSSAVLELTTTVSGKVDEPYRAPKVIRVTCSMDKGKVCDVCPIMAQSGNATVEVRPDDEALMSFVEATKEQQRKSMREMSGARCTDRAEFEMDEKWHIYPLTVQPSIDDSAAVSTPVHRSIYSVSERDTVVRTNEKVRFIGKNVGDAKTNQLRFLAWHAEPVELDIDKFEMTPALRERLSVFQTKGSPLDKALSIAADMSENVTHIFDRDLLHVGYDLVWHSPLSFSVGAQQVRKGWLEMMVVGDTRTGKSEIAEKLVGHYRSGRMVSCEGMSFAGIVGGLQQFGNNRFETTWGVVPMNDRRLVLLDEVSGLADKQVIDKMSSVRSSGVAQIVKIRTDETSARTRLIWISNPPNGRMIADQNDKSIGALRDIAPNAEDQARFDFVMATAKGDVSSERINSGFSYTYDPEYSSEDCEALIKWVWSLKAHQIRFSDKAVEAATAAAIELGKRFLPEPPLIQAENARYKLLRIAAALAARTFNISPKVNALMVDSKHVHDAVRFLEEVYSEPAMGYAALSEKHWDDVKKAKSSYTACVATLQEKPEILRALEQFTDSDFTQADFRSMSGLEGSQVLQVVSQLQQWKMITRRGRNFRITPTLSAAMGAAAAAEDV